MQFDLVKEVLTGSITGYITNALAIKMIFREYGVGNLKIGGVVIKTREEFIDNVSSLVERDIINEETLSNELEKQSFKDSIEKFVDDLLNAYIYETIDDLHLKEVKGIDSTIGKIQEYIDAYINDNFPVIFDSICKNISMKDLLSKNQIEHISEELFNISLDSINRYDFIEKTIDDFYNENKQLSPNELLGSEVMNVISNNLKKDIWNFFSNLKINYDEEIDSIFENTLGILETRKILVSLEEKIANKRILDLINYQEDMHASEKLKNKIKDFLQSNEGENLINNLSGELLNILKSINKPIVNLFSNNLEGDIEKLLEYQLKYAAEDIALWIEKNSEELEALVGKAVDDTIEEIDDSFKKNALNSFKDKLINDGVKKLEIVSKLKGYLNENADLNSVSKDITKNIIGYFKEEKVSSIIEVLVNNKIISTQSFASYLKYSVIEYVESVPEDYFNLLLDSKIKDIINLNLVDIFEAHAKKPLLGLIKTKYIYTEKLADLATEELVRSINEISKRSFEHLIDKDTLNLNSVSMKQLIETQLINNKKNIINLLSQELDSYIHPMSLNSGINEELRRKLLNEFSSKILYKVDVLLDNSKNIEVKTIWDKIKSTENIGETITKSIQLLLKDNLKYVLHGNIKKTVANNLSNLKDEELQIMVEQFMGKEMQPITVIGAVLGAIVGVGMYFFDRSVSQFSYLTSTFISVVVYAFVGWITNVQALAMLFKPYTEKRILGIRIPFTPGVIVSRKPKFAKSMGSFVDEELLNKSSIESLFDRNKYAISSSLNQIIEKDNYKVMRDFINKYSQDISNKGVEYGKGLIQRNKFKISNVLTEELYRFNLNNLDFSKIKSRMKNSSFAKIKESNIIIGHKMSKVLESNVEVSKIFPAQFKTLVKKELANNIGGKINNLSDSIGNEEKRNILLLRFKEEYEKLTNKPINNVINNREVLGLKEQLYDSVASKITYQQTVDKTVEWLQYLVSRELTPNKELRQLFNGFFVKIVEDNFSHIMDNGIKAILNGISKKQQVIAEVAITSTKENLNFFEIIGYNMLGGDQIISDIVDNFINNKLPSFIDDKRYEFNGILENFINNKIYTSTINDLNVTIEHQEVANIISDIISDSGNTLSLKNSVFSIVDSVIDWTTSMTVQEHLSELSINKMEDLIYVFREELEFIQRELKDTINVKKAMLVNEYALFFYNIVENLILLKKPKVLLEGVEHRHIDSVSKELSNLLFNSKSINKNYEDFIQFLIDTKIKNKGIDKFLDLKELNKSMLYVLEKIIENEEFHKEAGEITSNVIEEIVSNNLEFIDDETKQWILNIVINLILDSATENFSAILNNIDFRDITEKQINKMKPREIEELFNSFAEKYFNKLKIYGFGGGVFGLHWSLGIIACALYLGYGMRNKGIQ